MLREQCKRAGISDFITKPFRVENLQRVLRDLQGYHVPRQSPPEIVEAPEPQVAA